MEAAYTIFLQNGFGDFQSYAFEIQTVALQNLNPQRVMDYMAIIFHHQQGLAACQVEFNLTEPLIDFNPLRQR